MKKLNFDIFIDLKTLRELLYEFKPQIKWEMSWDNYFVIQVPDNMKVDKLGVYYHSNFEKSVDLVECDLEDETVKLAMSSWELGLDLYSRKEIDEANELFKDANPDKKFYKGKITLFETRIKKFDSLIEVIDEFFDLEMSYVDVYGDEDDDCPQLDDFSYNDLLDYLVDTDGSWWVMGDINCLMVGDTNISLDKFFSFAKTKDNFNDPEFRRMKIYIEDKNGGYWTDGFPEGTTSSENPIP